MYSYSSVKLFYGGTMEGLYIEDRAWLRQLLAEHPVWSTGQFAQTLKRTCAWVRKWRDRFEQADADDQGVLWGLPRVPQRRKLPIPPKIEAAIVDIRQNPPLNLGRTPGPKAILYYLHNHEVWQHFKEYLPRSTRTIWKILCKYNLILHRKPFEHVPFERPDPLLHWDCDWKDISSVPADPEGKQQHVVETLNLIDRGTSIAVACEVRSDFNMATTVETLAEVFAKQGLPREMTIDRDTRLVGSATARDFPSALIRFLQCLGIQVNVCDPRRPDQKGFVERFNRAYKYECLWRERPQTLEEAKEVTEKFKRHYNAERPNQAITCHNQPPYVAFPELPTLPTLPETVDPDGWFKLQHGKLFTRRIDRAGVVKINDEAYYVKQELKGQMATLEVNAEQCQFIVYVAGLRLKQFAIKHLYGRVMAFQEYLSVILKEASAEVQQVLVPRRV
jgi:transposase InsO family protein